MYIPLGIIATTASGACAAFIASISFRASKGNTKRPVISATRPAPNIVFLFFDIFFLVIVYTPNISINKPIRVSRLMKTGY